MQTTSTLGAITTSIATTADATRTICDDTPTDATPTGAVSVSGSLFFGFDSPSNDSGLSPLYSCDQCCVERTFNSTTDPEWDNTPYASAIDCVQLRDSIIHKRYVGGMETKITQHVKGDGFPRRSRVWHLSCHHHPEPTNAQYLPFHPQPGLRTYSRRCDHPLGVGCRPQSWDQGQG
ncbi:hypothetical protein PG995_006996 [Apiospora arundinis]